MHDAPTFLPIRRRALDTFYLDAQQFRRARAIQDPGFTRLCARVRAATAGGPALTPDEIRRALEHGLISMTTPKVTSRVIGSIAQYDRASGSLTPVTTPDLPRPEILTREINGCLEIGIGRSFDRWANSVDFFCFPKTDEQRALFLEAAREAAQSGDRHVYNPGWALRLEIVMKRGVPLIIVDKTRPLRGAFRPRAQPGERSVSLIPDGWRWERAYLARPPGWLRGEVPLERMETLLPETMTICLRQSLVKAGIRSADVLGISLTRRGVTLRLAPPPPWEGIFRPSVEVLPARRVPIGPMPKGRRNPSRGSAGARGPVRPGSAE